jgi:hypothetical protein
VEEVNTDTQWTPSGDREWTFIDELTDGVESNDIALLPYNRGTVRPRGKKMAGSLTPSISLLTTPTRAPRWKKQG